MTLFTHSLDNIRVIRLPSVFSSVFSNLACNAIQESENDNTDLQCLWMEITPPKSKGFILCSCYRPPNVDNEAACNYVFLRNSPLVIPFIILIPAPHGWAVASARVTTCAFVGLMHDLAAFCDVEHSPRIFPLQVSCKGVLHAYFRRKFASQCRCVLRCNI